MRHLATNFLSNLPPWMWPGDDRPPAEIEDEVREELRLHLDLLTEENERRGAPPDEARAAAERRFGDLDLLSRRCRRIKQGDIPMLNRIQVVLTGLLLLAVIFLVIRDWNLGVSTIQFVDQTTASLQTIRSDLAELRTVVSPAATAAEVNPPVAEPADPQAGQFRIAELSVENLQQRCAASKALLEQHTKKLALQRKASAEIESAADREVEQAENKLDEARAKLMKLEVDLRQAGAVIAGVKEDVQAGVSSKLKLEAAEAARERVEIDRELARKNVERAESAKNRALESRFATQRENASKAKEIEAAVSKAEQDLLKQQAELLKAQAELARF